MITPSLLLNARLWISAALPAQKTAAGFAALPFTQVRGCKVFGTLVTQYQTAPYMPIGGETPYQRRVGRAPASWSLDLYRISDAGQEMLAAAAASGQAHSFQLTVPGLGVHYFSAEVSGLGLALGGAAALAEISLSLELRSEVLAQS